VALVNVADTRQEGILVLESNQGVLTEQEPASLAAVVVVQRWAEQQLESPGDVVVQTWDVEYKLEKTELQDEQSFDRLQATVHFRIQS
jgi:hypothetical protein